MTYRMILKKYIGKKLKPGMPSGFYWTLREDSALWQYHYLDTACAIPKEKRFVTLVHFDKERVITEIDDPNSSVLIQEGLRSSAFRKGPKPKSQDYQALADQLAECIEE